MAGSRWRNLTLGEFVRLQRGHDLPDVARRPGNVPVFGSAGQNGFHDEARAHGPGVTIGRSGVGSMGVVCYAPVDFWPHNTTLYVTDFLGNNPRFVYYFLKSIQLRRFDSGSAQASLNRNFIYPIPITVPRRDEQDRIESLLGALDDQIDLNRRMNETLEAMARAIFQDWFVTFGPTRAKQEGRPPYLAPDLWSLFPDRLGGNDKPEGWGTGTLADVSTLNPESWSARNMPAEIEYLDLSSAKNGEIEATQQFARDDAPSRAQRILRPGDTVVGTVRPGNRSFALIAQSGLTGSTGFAVLRPKSMFREIVYLAATADDAVDFLAHRADGAAYPAVRPDVVSGLTCTLPPDRVAAAFSTLVAPLIDRMATNRLESRTLATTRDLLLPKLMSGELRVKDAEHLAEAAL